MDAPIPMKMTSRSMSHSVIEEYVVDPAYGRTVHHRVLRIGMEHTPVVTTIIATQRAKPPRPPTIAPTTPTPFPVLTSHPLLDAAVCMVHPFAPPARLERATYGLEIRSSTML